jgi:hypothetical protein
VTVTAGFIYGDTCAQPAPFGFRVDGTATVEAESQCKSKIAVDADIFDSNLNVVGVADTKILELADKLLVVQLLHGPHDLHWACPAHARRTTSLIAGSAYAAGASSQSTTRVVTSAGRRRPASMRGITSGSSAAA